MISKMHKKLLVALSGTTNQAPYVHHWSWCRLHSGCDTGSPAAACSGTMTTLSHINICVTSLLDQQDWNRNRMDTERWYVEGSVMSRGDSHWVESLAALGGWAKPFETTFSEILSWWKEVSDRCGSKPPEIDSLPALQDLKSHIVSPSNKFKTFQDLTGCQLTEALALKISMSCCSC